MDKTYPVNEFLKLVSKEAEIRKYDKSNGDLKKVQEMIDKIRKIDAQYSDIKNNNIDAFDYYFGVNYMTDVDGRSKIYTSDLRNTIEWVMPSLMKIFAGGDDVCSLQPRNQEKAKQVENHNELINYQLKTKNKWFEILNSWFRDALLLKRGAVKYQWFEETEIDDDDDFFNATQEDLIKYASDPNITKVIIEKENEDGTLNGYIEKAVGDEFPLVEAVPSEEYGFPVDTREIDSCSFFYHRCKYDQWDFTRRFGKPAFEKVKELRDSFLDITDDLSVDQERFVDINGVAIKFFYDINENKWLVYECYYRNPDNGKAWIRAICGNNLLEDKKNKYKKPPFELITPIKLAHRIIGVSLFDILKDLQKIRTSLLRQMLDNVYFNNNGRTLLDPTRVNFETFLKSNRPGGVVLTLDGTPADEKCLFPIPTPQLQPWAFEVFELMNKEDDYATGVPRSFQGVNPNIINKTMRGQNQQIQQAQQRIEMMARLFAEMGIAPLVKDIVDMNSRFLKKETALKVVNDWITVAPEDTVAKADIIINVGLGTGNKDIVIGQMQQLIGLYLKLQSSGFNVAGSEQVHNAMKELVKAMGYRNVDDFVSNPKANELLAQLLQHLIQGLSQENFNPQAMIGLIEQVGEAFGIFPKKGQGQGTAQGEQPPAIEEQPDNEMNLPETIPPQNYYG
jgi:hypothetical protein